MSEKNIPALPLMQRQLLQGAVVFRRPCSEPIYKDYKDTLSVNLVDNYNLLQLINLLKTKTGVDKALYYAVHEIE